MTHQSACNLTTSTLVNDVPWPVSVSLQAHPASTNTAVLTGCRTYAPPGPSHSTSLVPGIFSMQRSPPPSNAVTASAANTCHDTGHARHKRSHLFSNGRASLPSAAPDSNTASRSLIAFTATGPSRSVASFPQAPSSTVAAAVYPA